jgi:hypothetical protein
MNIRGALFLAGTMMGGSVAGAERLPAEPNAFGVVSVLRLENADVAGSDGAIDDAYGRALAISGNTLVIGANLDDVGGAENPLSPVSPYGDDTGSAYVYVRDTSGWTLQAKLSPADAAGEDLFGHSVAIEGDTIVVGAPTARNQATPGTGCAYVFVRQAGAWVQQARLATIFGRTDDLFGWSVAISGDRVLIGAPEASSPGRMRNGLAYSFERTGNMWSEQTTISTSSPKDFSRFGEAVAIVGTRALVGAPSADGLAISSGAAYSYAVMGPIALELGRLIASDGEPSEGFGSSIAMSGSSAIVGASSDSSTGVARHGSAYIFVRNAAESWTQQAKLSTPLRPLIAAGRSVALEADTALIGAPFETSQGASDRGIVFPFTRSGTVWTAAMPFEAPIQSAEFGQAVALAAGEAIVGMPKFRVGMHVDQGGAQAFVRVGNAWTVTQTLHSGNGVSHWRLGTSVAMSPNEVAIGIPGAYDGNVQRGAVQTYARAASGWVPAQRLFDVGGGSDNGFAHSIALFGDWMAVGAPNAIGDRGAVTLYQRVGGLWLQRQRILAPDGNQGWLFGTAVGMVGNQLLVGAPGVDVGAQSDRGAVYVFELNAGTWAHSVTLFAGGGAAGDRFGSSVAIAPELRAVFGAPGRTQNGNAEQGGAYVFERFGLWVQVAALSDAGGAARDGFGSNVAIMGNLALVGAPRRDVSGTVDAGMVHWYERTDVGWVARGTIVSPTPSAGEGYGTSLALEGLRALVGAPASLNGRGRAYALARAALGWQLVQTLEPAASPGEFRSQFGAALALAAEQAAIGQPDADNAPPFGNPGVGRVHVFSEEPLFSNGFE